MDVLCIGSAVVDIMAQPVGKSGEWKEKQRISDIRIQVGGDAANQGIRLAELGYRTAVVGGIGTDQNGDFLRNSLELRRVCTEFLAVKEGWQTGTALVLVDGQGERHTFSVDGAHSHLTREDVRGTLGLRPRAVSLASLFSMPEFERDGLLEYLRRVREEGALVFADLASDKRKQGLEGIRRFLPLIDYFLPSLYDALEMTGAENAEEAARVYRECGVPHVVIKCGADGCLYDAASGSGWAPAVPVRPVDTTGAGDCMVALFISRILSGDRFGDACRYACAGASCSTRFWGANGGALTPEFLEEWMRGKKAEKREAPDPA